MMTLPENTLRKVLHTIFEEKNENKKIVLKPYICDGANYTSSLFSITISSEDDDELKLFAKVANTTGEIYQLARIRYLFETEQFVYTKIADVYERLQDKYNVVAEHKFKFPKFYGGDDTNGKETVVFEDLASRGYTTYSRFDSLDWDHAASAITVLARFHALSFAFAKEDPDNFARVLEKVKLKQYNNTKDLGMKDTWMKMMATAVRVAREEHKEKVKQFLCREMSTEEMNKFRLPLSTPVLCHGDFRSNNLMFKEQNGSIETIVVDYQAVRSASPAVDLLYLVFLGTDEEFRKENHDRLLDKYFHELTLSLDKFGLNVNEVYSREVFDRELQEMIPGALLKAAYILPLVLVDADHTPQLQNGVEDFVITPNQQFVDRFSGLVSDCVRWGAI